MTNIVVTPIVAVTQSTTLTGCNSVTFNGIVYNSSTSLKNTIKSFQGCDSVYVVTNIVVTPIIAVTKTTTLSGCNSVSYNGIVYTNSTVLRQTISSYQGCDSVYIVTIINVNQIIPVTQQTTINGCSGVNYNGILYTSSTVLNQTIKSYQDCDSVYQIIKIIVNPLPVVSVSIPSKVCIGNPVTSTYNSSLVNIDSAFWNMGNGVIENVFDLNYTYQNPGYYSVFLTVKDINGCVSKPVNLSVKVIQNPVIGNLYDTTVFSGAVFQINAFTDVISQTISWQPFTYLSDNTILNPVCTPFASTIYSLKVVDSNGCYATKAYNVKVINIPQIPNTFSPNGDGNHDKWVFGNTSADNYTEVNVYDRNGQKVYSNYNYDNSWDGTASGQPLPIGTYYYIIKLNNVYTLSGWVMIIR